MHKESTGSKILRLADLMVRVTLRNRSGLRNVLGNALAVAERVVDPQVDVTNLPETTLEAIAEKCPFELTIKLRAMPSIGSSITLFEALGLVTLMRSIKAERVFEFGTYRGVSTTQLALNVPEGGRVFTLDLPPRNVQTKFDLRTAAEINIAQLENKGELIPGELRDRITFLHQDSALFDERAYAGMIDFVFVDGAHTPEYVRNDSEKGWRMLRDGGIIAWHDCRHNSPGVAEFLLRSEWRPKRLGGGSLAFAKKNERDVDKTC